MSKKQEIRTEQLVDFFAMVIATIILIVTALLLSSCGTQNDPNTTFTNEAVTVQSDYGEYGDIVEEFKGLVFDYTGVYPDDHIGSIAWDKQSSPPRFGTCYLWYKRDGVLAYENIAFARIVLDPYLSQFDFKLLRAVLFHELGHCIMASDHVDDAKDLMNPTTPSELSEAQIDARIKHYMERLAKD